MESHKHNLLKLHRNKDKIGVFDCHSNRKNRMEERLNQKLVSHRRQPRNKLGVRSHFWSQTKHHVFRGPKTTLDFKKNAYR